jgi:hypothetical protein
VKHGYALSVIALLVGVGGPYAALEYWTDGNGGRSAADIEIADECVQRAHGKGVAPRPDPPGSTEKCDRYFRYRSEREADEDEMRFRARSGNAQR